MKTFTTKELLKLYKNKVGKEQSKELVSLYKKLQIAKVFTKISDFLNEMVLVAAFVAFGGLFYLVFTRNSFGSRTYWLLIIGMILLINIVSLNSLMHSKKEICVKEVEIIDKGLYEEIANRKA